MKSTYKNFSIRHAACFIVFLFALSAYGLVYAFNTISAGFQTTTANVIVDAHGECRQIRHIGSQSYFVPTRTAAEWTAFRNNNPSDVLLNGCVDRYPGCNSDDITIGSYTIAACNVGSTIAGTTNSSIGRFFQWGENTAWRRSPWTDERCRWDRDAQTCTSPFNSPWISSITSFVSDTQHNGPDRWFAWGDLRGPCAEGYRVPTRSDWQSIISAGGWGNNDSAMKSALLMPNGGYKNAGSGNFMGQDTALYWTSSPHMTRDAFFLRVGNGVSTSNASSRNTGYQIRCIKD